MGHHSSHGRSDGSRIHGPRTEEFRDGLREGSRQIRNLATERHKNHSAATPQPNVDDVAGWTELECVIFPSSQRRGGCAIKKMPRSHKIGADTPPLRGGECAAPKTLSKKTKSCSLVTQRCFDHLGAFCGYSRLYATSATFKIAVSQQLLHHAA